MGVAAAPKGLFGMGVAVSPVGQPGPSRSIGKQPASASNGASRNQRIMAAPHRGNARGMGAQNVGQRISDAGFVMTRDIDQQNSGLGKRRHIAGDLAV